MIPHYRVLIDPFADPFKEALKEPYLLSPMILEVVPQPQNPKPLKGTPQTPSRVSGPCPGHCKNVSKQKVQKSMSMEAWVRGLGFFCLGFRV